MSKPILITLDGSSGAGKTTHVESLKKDHAIPQCHFRGLAHNIGFKIMDDNYSSFGHTSPLCILHELVSLKLAQKERWNKRNGIIVVVDFWERFIQCQENVRDRGFLNFYREMLNLWGGYEPDLSLYLRITEKESRRRVAEREGVMLRDEGAKPIDIVHQQIFKQNSDWLAKELPYFQIVDAMEPEGVVYCQIVKRIMEAKREQDEIDNDRWVGSIGQIDTV